MSGAYEPPCCQIGSVFSVGEEDILAPGVRGYAVEKDELILIPLIIAEKEGSGDVGRFLDSLSPRCAIPNVTSPRLMGMLARRGFIPVFGKDTEVWRR